LNQDTELFAVVPAEGETEIPEQELKYGISGNNPFLGYHVS